MTKWPFNDGGVYGPSQSIDQTTYYASFSLKHLNPLLHFGWLLLDIVKMVRKIQKCSHYFDIILTNQLD